MATQTLTDKINEISGLYGFSLADINSSPTLLSLIANYNGSYIDDSVNYNGAYYDSNTNTIVMAGVNYVNLSTLAHELGHATGM